MLNNNEDTDLPVKLRIVRILLLYSGSISTT